MAKEDGSIICVNAEAGERRAGGLFKTVDGQRVLRQLTSQETGIISPPTITTPEGFKIRGENSRNLILGLKELTLLDADGNLYGAPTPISFIEHELRPMDYGDEWAQKYRSFDYGRRPELRHELDQFPHGILREGFIGKDESLVELMASANDEVIAMNKISEKEVTHTKLGAFLLYFEKAFSFAKTNKAYEEIGVNTGSIEDPLYFELDGRIYLWDSERRRPHSEHKRSPFKDGDFNLSDTQYLCLARANEGDTLLTPSDPYYYLKDRRDNSTGDWIEDGRQQITFNGRFTPKEIIRWGFYGGRDLSNRESKFRLSPREIAELGGFIPSINNVFVQ